MSLPRRALVLACPPTSRHALVRMALGAGVVIAVGLLLGSWVDARSPVAVEQRALTAVAEQRSPAATMFFTVVSTMGDLWVVSLVAVLVTAFLQRRPGGWQAAWLLWSALLGALLVTALIKVVVGRARPLDALVAADSGAFPSGHTSRAAAVLGLLAVAALLARHPLVRTALVSICGLGIGLMGFSRIYLGVHWPTDVAYGLVVGVAWLAVLLAAVRPSVVAAAAVGPEEPVLIAGRSTQPTIGGGSG